MEPTFLHILGKLHTVMSNIDRIKKDKKNTHQNYEYASEKAIKEELHKQFVEQKILFLVSTGNPQMVGSSFCLDVSYRFVDVESGESFQGTLVGTGQTRDEKGNYAAITGAIKYILTSNFLIPTGDDPEKDEPAKKLKTDKKLTATSATAAQLAQIDDLSKQLGGTSQQVFDSMCGGATPTLQQASSILTILRGKLSKDLDSKAA